MASEHVTAGKPETDGGPPPVHSNPPVYPDTDDSPPDYPSPWSHNHRFGHIMDANGNTVVLFASRFAGHDAEIDALGRLLIAAPEMRAALEVMVAEWDKRRRIYENISAKESFLTRYSVLLVKSANENVRRARDILAMTKPEVGIDVQSIK